jgi:hypothetical protein
MLQNLTAEIMNCYERARQAREKAECAISAEFKAEFLAAESQWLALAESYDNQQRLSLAVTEFERRRKAGAINRMLRETGDVFEPEVIARLTVAYKATLDLLRLADREDTGTLMVAKRIIDLATQGERDPERLMAATIEVLPLRLLSLPDHSVVDQGSTDAHRLAATMWQKASSAPFGQDLELALIDYDGPHSLGFPCRRVLRGWVNAETKERVDVRPTHWRRWEQAS